jgi:hypothetical protein
MEWVLPAIRFSSEAASWFTMFVALIDALLYFLQPKPAEAFNMRLALPFAAAGLRISESGGRCMAPLPLPGCRLRELAAFERSGRTIMPADRPHTVVALDDRFCG